MPYRTVRSIIAAVYCLSLSPVMVYSEGTKQVMPAASAHGQLCIDKYRNDFAFYDASTAYRLNIAIADVSETIRFGFGAVISADYSSPTTLNFRIKDPSGNIVFGPTEVPAYGPGSISSYDQAVAGPFPGAGGYDFMKVNPSVPGNYYLEFDYLPYNIFTGYTHEDKHMLQFFDITVVNSAGEAIDGRVWSEAWQFWSEGPDNSTSRFYGKMMVLSDDSIVTQVDCNGFRGGTFTFSSNMTGCANTGSLAYDRRSRQGFYTYPQYKVFLNNPDSILFPTAKISSGIIGIPSFNPDCSTGGGVIGVTVKKEGTVKILIEVNPSPGSDPEDAEIVASVTTGENWITWDGNNNTSMPVPNGTAMTMRVTYLSGLSHLPMYDIEYNDYGYIIEQIRPSGGELEIFWDDTNIGGSSNTVNGCGSASGCHTWTTATGNNNTINSWWYINMSDIPSVSIVSKRTPATLVITGSGLHCLGSGAQEYSIAADYSSTGYTWSYSGTGAIILGSGTSVKLDFSSAATSGALSVHGHNDDCGDGPEGLLNITVAAEPEVNLADFPDVCYTAPAFLLEGGQPTGGVYSVDGAQADSLSPYKEPEGLHTIIYVYTAPSGCSGSDTAEILLRSGSDCEGFLKFPDAFTPNNDGSNDIFKPAVVKNVYRFRMEIYNRWGLFIYSTENTSRGWDGKYNGQECPAGVYVYTVTYGLSMRSADNGKMNGILTLLR